MLAARLLAPGEPIRLVELPDPVPVGTEVRIRVAGCGVCRTDLHIVDGLQTRIELPLTLGHEVAGFIDHVGGDAGALLDQAGLAIGDPVLVYGGWGCGACRECAAGAEQRCPFSRAPGFQADGGYADLMLVPHPRHLVALDGLDPVRAAPLADAGVTPYRAVRRAEPWLRPGARVLVIGAGALGRFALQYLRLFGSDELVVGLAELDGERLERATALGAAIGLVAPDAAAILAALDGPADVVLDFVGTDETLANAAAVVAPGGLVELIGEAGGHVSFGFDAPPVESWLTTVAWGSVTDLREVVEIARTGPVTWEVEPLPLADAPGSLERVRAGTVSGRLVLVP